MTIEVKSFYCREKFAVFLRLHNASPVEKLVGKPKSKKH